MQELIQVDTLKQSKNFLDLQTSPSISLKPHIEGTVKNIWIN